MAIAYSPAITGDWQSDDVRFVSENPGVHELSLDAAVRCFTDPRTVDPHNWQGIYRPVRTLEFAVDWAISGGRTWFFHVRSILYHVLGCWLALALFSRLLGRRSTETADPRALAGALLFALHPVHTEAVAWISSRADVLSLCLVLGGLVLHLDGKAWAGALALVAALFTKESAVVFVALALLADRLAGRGFRWRAYAAYAGVGALFVLLWYFMVGRGTSYGIAQTEYWWGGSYPMSLLVTGKGLLYYARLLVLPVDLAFDYYVPARSAIDTGAIVSLCVLALVIAAMARGGSRSRFALLWFLVAILPVSNVIVRVAIPTAERFLLLPAVGVAFWVGCRAAKTRLVWVVLTCFLALTFTRCFVWREDATFWREALDAAESPRALAVRSSELIQRALVTQREEDAEAVIENWNRFLRLHERDIQLAPDGGVIFLGQAAGYVLWDRARALHLLGRDEEAVEQAQASVQMGGPPDAHLTAAFALERLDRRLDAAAAYRLALEGGVQASGLSSYLARLLYGLGRESEVDGRDAAALSFYRESWQLHPDPTENADARKGIERLER